jgi:ComF family protein
MLRDAADALLAVLLAPLCAACSEPLPHPTRGCVCSDCWNSVLKVSPPVCMRCGGHVDPFRVSVSSSLTCDRCLAASSPISCARAAGLHVGSLRAIVHAVKYDGRRSLAPHLATLMRAAAPDVLGRCNLAVPVPLHPARRRERGFNQADDLARHLGLPVVHALKRLRHTPTQTALPASERKDNVNGAFGPTRRAASLRDKAVLLVDDVRTTGATLEACADVLKGSGAREVCALTAARVETPGS